MRRSEVPQSEVPQSEVPQRLDSRARPPVDGVNFGRRATGSPRNIFSATGQAIRRCRCGALRHPVVMDSALLNATVRPAKIAVGR